MPTTITLRDLDDPAACPKQRELFAAAFPEGVTIDADNYRAVAKAAVEAGLKADWYADRVLTCDERTVYEAAVGPVLTAHESACLTAYEAALAPAGATREVAVAQTRAASRAAFDQLRATQAEALCSILARRTP